jgi:AcrR family transcriptional regulator
MRTPPKPARASRKTARAAEAAPRPYHHGDLRASLLDAADAVLAERGPQGLTLRDVAREAGVSHAAPYHHYAGLNDLLAALAERGFVALGDAMAEAVAVPDTRERLLRVTQAYVDHARAHPARFRLMFGPLLATQDTHPALKAAARRAFGFVLAAAQAHDPRRGTELALAGWSLAHGLSHLLIDGAFDDLPLKKPAPDTLARKLGERLLD